MKNRDSFKKNQLIEMIIGSRVVKIDRACNLIMITFKMQNRKELNLHAQCLVRIFDSDGTLVVCTQNLYTISQSNNSKEFDWTKLGSTLFDDSINDYKEKIFGTSVKNAKFDNDDVKIVFTNGMRMDILLTTTKYDDQDYCEDYRLFDDDENKSHYCFPKLKNITNRDEQIGTE